MELKVLVVALAVLAHLPMLLSAVMICFSSTVMSS